MTDRRNNTAAAVIARRRAEAARKAADDAVRAASDAERAYHAALVAAASAVFWMIHEDRAVAAVVETLRRAERKTVEPSTRRPVHETAAFLVNTVDDGFDAAERAARRYDVDAVAGVPFADRVDERPWFLALREDGTEAWMTVPDPVEF